MELIVTVIVMLFGLVGVMVPVLPGVPFMWFIALAFGALTRFEQLRANELGMLALLAILSLVIDYSSGAAGARWSGASKRSITFGIVGMIIGLILFPPFGAILGLAFGVFISEIRAHRDEKRAGKAAIGTLVGTLGGMVINLIVAATFLWLFIAFARS